jgi:hypothetical protein
VDLDYQIPVKTVRILNVEDGTHFGSDELTSATVELLAADKTTILESHIIDDADGKKELNISFGYNTFTDVLAWASPPKLLSIDLRLQMRAQMSNAMDLFDNSIALIFGNKTTIGQVCSFAQGLESKTVNKIPGFCCLDAPYQSIEHWGEKVSFWDKKVKEKLVLYCSIKTNRFFSS